MGRGDKWQITNQKWEVTNQKREIITGSARFTIHDSPEGADEARC